MERVTQCISDCLRACKHMLESNNIAYRHYPKYSTRLGSAKSEFERINKRLSAAMFKLQRKLKHKKAKRSLLESANKASFAQADETS